MDASAILTLLGAAISAVVWLVRLEGKIKALEDANNRTQKDVDELRVRHHALDSNVLQQLRELSISIARIEGKLGIEKHD